MLTLSPEEFKKQYGESIFPKLSQVTQKKPGLLDRAMGVIKQSGQNVQEQISGEGQFSGQSPIRRGVGATATAFSTPLKLGYEALPQPAKTGVDYVGKKIGQGFGSAVNKLSETNLISEAAMSGKTRGLEEALGTAGGLGEIAGNILVADQASKALQGGVNVAKRATSKAVDAGGDLTKQVTDVARAKAGSQPAKIMQRVARINKSKQAKFEKMAGESVGDYLTKRGIYGNIEEITQKLYQRFTKSKSVADDALAKLKGEFDPPPVKTMLDELYARELRVSSPGAPSPILGEVTKLIKKGRWNMSEINQIKRLYERNVKVDYLKTTNPEGVAKATNLDSAVREWQFRQAETLGLKNLPKINQETRLAKQLMDDLGAEYSGQAGNNAVTLTDWIMLSGGDPTAIGGFLLKKGFSSKSVQSAIAKALNKGKPVMGDVQADIGTSQVLQLPAPKGGPRTMVGGGAPIRVAPRGSNIEMTGKQGITSSSRTTQPQPQSPKTILQKPSSDPTTGLKNKQGGFIDFNEIAKMIDNVDKDRMIAFIEAVNAGKTPAKDVAFRAQKIADAMGLESRFGTNKALAKDFNAILDAERAIVKKKLK